MFTQSTEITLSQTATLPTPIDISEFLPGDYRAKAAALDGKVIQETNKTLLPTASTAKIILSLAIMEKKPFSLGEEGERITISPESYEKYLWYISHNGSTTKVLIGEQISQYDAIASVLMVSSNNMADTLATWAFGSMDEYRSYATEMLARLGATDTIIGTDASGYSETTISTASDLCIIATALLRNPVLREIVGQKTYSVPVAGLLENTNKILGEPLGDSVAVSGVKTGYIGDISGYNLVSAYEYDGHIIVLTLLGATSRASSFEGSKNELIRLFSELKSSVIVKSGENVGYYETWWNGRHDIVAEENLSAIILEDQENSITLSEQGLTVIVNGEEHHIKTTHDAFDNAPNIWQRFLHLFGWHA